MKKRIIALSAIAFTLLTVNAAAKTDESFNVYTARTENKIVKIEADIPDGNAVAVIYNSDGVMYSASPVTIKNHECKTDIDYPSINYKLNLYYDIGSDSFLSIKSDETKYIPQDDTKPEKPDKNPSNPGSNPSKPDDNQNGNNNSGTNPGISETAKTGSVAVVKDSGTEYDSDSDQVISYIDVLYNNKEIRIKLDEDFKISNAAESLSYMIGKSVTELEKGDILGLDANLSGRLYRINLLFRAPQTDPVSDGGDSSLFDLTDDGVMFGLIQNKPVSQVLVLYDNTGKSENAVYTDIEPDTVVYFYDASKKNDNLRVGTASEIFKSFIPSADYDDNDNITNWSENCTHNYAFVRTYNDSVVNIVVYENYEIN